MNLFRANGQSCNKVERTFDTKAKAKLNSKASDNIKQYEQYKEDTNKLIYKLLK